MAQDPQALGILTEASCIDLTTRGRKSGKPRTVELSFALKGSEIVCLAALGGKVHWYQNLMSDTDVLISVGTVRFKARAIPVSESKKLAREIMELFREKYGAGYVSSSYSGTHRAPVRIKLLERD